MIDDNCPCEEIDTSDVNGLAVQEIIEAAIRSHETGAAVEVPID